MQNFLIFGFGMMGSSFAGLIRRFYPNSNIVASDPNLDNINFGIENSIINAKYSAKTSFDYDLVVIATPLSSYEDVLNILNASKQKYKLLIDLGSLNSYLYNFLNSKNVISCHPICGSEISGTEGYDPKIYDNANFLISRSRDNAKCADDIFNFAAKLGMRPSYIDPFEHDKIYALVSHLPQFLSFLTKDYSSSKLKKLFPAQYRLDDSSNDIWSDIFSNNQVNLQHYYEEFFENMANFIEKVDSKSFGKIASEILSLSSHNISSIKDNGFDLSNLSPEERSLFLFRLTIVCSYVKIKDVSRFRSYAGKGFSDFVSILDHLEKIDESDLFSMLKLCRSDLINYFNDIST